MNQKTFNMLLGSSNNSNLLDTASCDGPVKFHRIINKFFSVDLPKQQVKKKEEVEVNDDEVDETSKTSKNVLLCVLQPRFQVTLLPPEAQAAPYRPSDGGPRAMSRTRWCW